MRSKDPDSTCQWTLSSNTCFQALNFLLDPGSPNSITYSYLGTQLPFSSFYHYLAQESSSLSPKMPLSLLHPSMRTQASGPQIPNPQ